MTTWPSSSGGSSSPPDFTAHALSRPPRKKPEPFSQPGRQAEYDQQKLRNTRVLQGAENVPSLQVLDALVDPPPGGRPFAAQGGSRGQPLVSHPGVEMQPGRPGAAQASARAAARVAGPPPPPPCPPYNPIRSARAL